MNEDKDDTNMDLSPDVIDYSAFARYQSKYYISFFGYLFD